MSDKIWSSKKDFQELLLSIVEPLKPYYSEEKARLLLGVTATNYDRKAETMEAFSRPLWGLVPFWAGGGTEAGFEEIYRLGWWPGPILQETNFGVVFMLLTRNSWRWRLFPMV